MKLDTKQYKYLFLDRDGVINIERPNDYVKDISEFVFTDKALSAIQILSKKFEYIFIITNQRGVDRDVMTLEQLNQVHNHMTSEIHKAGGNITKIYYCTDLKAESINRKPNIGMGFQALRDYPFIDFSQSTMVGNSKSDIEFGNKLGMYTVLVGDKYAKGQEIYDNINMHYENLYKFADSL